jgi:hypothetical protein
VKKIQTAEEGYEVASEVRHTSMHLGSNETRNSSFWLYSEESNRSDDRGLVFNTDPRKVRAPVDRPPGNTWARAARVVRDGKCHRKQTATFTGGKGEKVG